MPTTLEPYFLAKVNEFCEKGYSLEDILNEYKDRDGMFNDEIIVAYYHINNGPDLRPYQKETLDDALEHFHSNKNYKLLWCCGLGKTKMALSIAKNMGVKSLLIGVPNILLLDQFAKELQYFYPLSSIFKLYSKLDLKNIDKKGPCISKLDLEQYLNSASRFKIILTTYHSANKILTNVKEDFSFDLVILDEVHHLQKKTNKLFSDILKIPCKNRLLLTATAYLGKDTAKLYSFKESQEFEGHNNIKSISWAIHNKYITDYNIIILKFSEIDLDLELFSKYPNKELIIAAYMALLCIFNNKSKKIIIYCNKIKNAKLVQQIIEVFLTEYIHDTNLFNKNNSTLEVGNYELNGSDSLDKRAEILSEFTNKEFGIMSSVQLFGEGYDYPQLDSVLFAEQMTSDIRIVQSGLRPCRIDPFNKEKVANILIPLYQDNYSKVKQIIQKMKTVHNIIDKIKIYDNSEVTNFTDKTPTEYNKFNKDLITNTILEKIELEYLGDSIKERVINNLVVNTRLENSCKVLLCPVSNDSFPNYYRSVLTQPQDECFWGLTKGNKQKWDKLSKNDKIVLIEGTMVSIGNIIEMEHNPTLSEHFWLTNKFEFVVKFKLLSRIKFNKRELMVKIGYLSTDNLMGCRIYKHNTSTINNLFTQ